MRIQVPASSGHTAYPGHSGGLGTELGVQVTDADGDLGHVVHVHIHHFQNNCTMLNKLSLAVNNSLTTGKILDNN